jgi:hypothetical protein
MTTDFSTAHLRGRYALAIAGEGGRVPFAALGLVDFDGDGIAQGTLIENRRGQTIDERAIVETAHRWHYTLGPEGLGTLTPESGDGVEACMVVRAPLPAGDASVVDEIALVFRDLDPLSGALPSGIGRRLPDGAVFGEASLAGRYAGFAVGRGGQMPIAGFGVLTYDGAGGFSETNVANVQAESARSRQFVHGTDQGRYQVNADGTGSVAGGGVLFVVTRASPVGGMVRADEYAFMVRTLVPANGAHFTGVVKRIAD